MAVTRAAVCMQDWGLWRQSALATRLGVPLSIISGLRPSPPDTAYVGWGLKHSGRRARHLAEQHSRECWLLEDGFLRSLGGSDSHSLSLVIDDEGIYYDASRPSRLERLITQSLNSAQSTRARALIGAWQRARVSKYNHGRDFDISVLPARYVLVVDQTAGDASINGGLANRAMFPAMLADALAAHPDCHVVLKVHPEVASGHKQGHFDIAALSSSNARLSVITDTAHPAILIAHAEAVYTVTSQVGFEALLWDKPVYVYGMPFYAGWGLTRDKLAPPPRRRPISLEQLVHASLIDYPRYFDPETGQRCQVETILDWLGFQRRERERFAPRLVAYGFSKWKQRIVCDFLKGSHVTFTDTLPRHSPIAPPLVTWGHKHEEDLSLNGYQNANVLRIEDGFIRSVGLGAEFTRPLSWVIDDIGIYYDARRPSKLENLLAHIDFSPELISRAAELRTALVAHGITKYNLQQSKCWKRPGRVAQVVLVIGQVETDAAIKYGTSRLQRNIDLLQAVRQAHPDAWLVYKPHPDVLAGLRDFGHGESQAHQWCDEIVTDIPFHTLLDEVDQVHVLSSLAGFEAILRGVPVVTWGQPFYAGWGLTLDHDLTEAVSVRRNRKLTTDQLVAATLILYPTYVSRKTRNFCSPERAIQELLEWRQEPSRHPVRRLIARIFRKP